MSSRQGGERRADHICQDLLEKGPVSFRPPRHRWARLVAKARPIDSYRGVCGGKPLLERALFAAGQKGIRGWQHQECRPRAVALRSNPNRRAPPIERKVLN